MADIIIPFSKYETDLSIGKKYAFKLANDLDVEFPAGIYWGTLAGMISNAVNEKSLVRGATCIELEFIDALNARRNDFSIIIPVFKNSQEDFIIYKN
jgi:hypothetical protein